MEFDFRKEESGVFGQIARPVARLILQGENGNRIPEIFYVDSGADITLLPRSLGELLGFHVKDPSEIKEIQGIGERGIPFVLRRIKITFNEETIEARIAWSLIEGVPPLLGRLDIFKIFTIIFFKERVTIFEE